MTNNLLLKGNSLSDLDTEFNIQELIEFYVDPKNLLEKKFKEKWEKTALWRLDICKENFGRSIDQEIKAVLKFIENFHYNLKAKKADMDSLSLFMKKKDLEALLNPTKIDPTVLTDDSYSAGHLKVIY